MLYTATSCHAYGSRNRRHGDFVAGPRNHAARATTQRALAPLTKADYNRSVTVARRVPDGVGAGACALHARQPHCSGSASGCSRPAQDMQALYGDAWPCSPRGWDGSVFAHVIHPDRSPWRAWALAQQAGTTIPRKPFDGVCIRTAGRSVFPVRISEAWHLPHFRADEARGPDCDRGVQRQRGELILERHQR